VPQQISTVKLHMEGESAIEFFPLGVVVLRNFIDDETQKRLYLSEVGTHYLPCFSRHSI